MTKSRRLRRPTHLTVISVDQVLNAYLAELVKRAGQDVRHKSGPPATDKGVHVFSHVYSIPAGPLLEGRVRP
jgi:hypothetical protein